MMRRLLMRRYTIVKVATIVGKQSSTIEKSLTERKNMLKDTIAIL